jgi:hypothetical protein
MFALLGMCTSSKHPSVLDTPTAAAHLLVLDDLL